MRSSPELQPRVLGVPCRFLESKTRRAKRLQGCGAVHDQDGGREVRNERAAIGDYHGLTVWSHLSNGGDLSQSTSRPGLDAREFKFQI